MNEHFKMSLQNISKHGDTDVLPYPVENSIFFDRTDEAVKILDDIHGRFDSSLIEMRPFQEGILSVVGYTGFRMVSQIDPIWNAYLLGCVLSIAGDIEKARIPRDRNTVFSYRFSFDEAEYTLFDKGYGWVPFQQHSLVMAKNFSHVLVSDISDFYPRIYHHRLENALKKATKNNEITRRIKVLLQEFSGGVSYGLPVGGQASRILSELLLNRIDRLLTTNEIRFCRFVDDYHIFASSREQAYSHLVLLSELLLENEGLTLQKEKTQILSAEEFVSTCQIAEIGTDKALGIDEARAFLSMHIHFDPYSPTAEEDYKALKAELRKYDIVGMLAREVQKSRIHRSLTKKLIRGIQHIDARQQSDAIRSLLGNFGTLLPVLPSVMLLLKAVIDTVDEDTRDTIFATIRSKIREGSYVLQVPVNLAYAIRVLAFDNSDEADEILNRLYDSTRSMIHKRDIILAMAKRDADHWISDKKGDYGSLSPWERRALLISSYILEDEGKHWRDNIKRGLNPVDVLARDWAAEKKEKGAWGVPL